MQGREETSNLCLQVLALALNHKRIPDGLCKDRSEQWTSSRYAYHHVSLIVKFQAWKLNLISSTSIAKRISTRQIQDFFDKAKFDNRFFVD